MSVCYLNIHGLHLKIRCASSWQRRRLAAAAGLFLATDGDGSSRAFEIEIPADSNSISFLPGVLGPILSPLFARIGVFAFHGAAFASRKRDRFLLVGGGNCGKSTIVLSALASGCQVVGDDTILYRRQGGRTVFLPFSAEILLKHGQEVVVYRPLPHLPNHVFTSLEPGVLVFPSIRPIPCSHLVPLRNRPRIFRGLVESNIWAEDKRSREEQLEVLTELSSLPAYELVLGEDHRRNPELALTLLESL